MRSYLALIFLVACAGCGSEAQLKPDPVSVSGVVSQSGRPAGGMMMVFHPLGDGHVREVPVQKDGSFAGELVPGDYAYYVARPAAAGAGQMVRKLSPKFFEADLARTVSIESGKQLAIALD